MRISPALIPLALAAAVHAAPPPRAELPIRLVTLSDGARRYAVPVTIDGTEMQAGLDTGSTGLRVLDRALTTAAKTGPSTHYQYSGGLTIEGGTETRAIAFGPIAAQTRIQRIARIGCTPAQPACAGKRLGMADFGLQGDGLKGEGFPAILGLDMADGDAPNPLVAAGVTRWIVELPRPGDSGPGRLILDPSDAETADYTRLPLIPALADRRAGIHDALPGCLVRTDTGARLCGPVLLDSGAPGLRVSLPELKAPWPLGTPGQLVVGKGAHVTGLAFTVGRRDQAAGMMLEPLAEHGIPHISAGLMPYFGWSVLYDAKAGMIGLKPR